MEQMVRKTVKDISDENKKKKKKEETIASDLRRFYAFLSHVLLKINKKFNDICICGARKTSGMGFPI